MWSLYFFLKHLLLTAENPYVQLALRKNICKTKVAAHAVTPVWNEAFNLYPYLCSFFFLILSPSSSFIPERKDANLFLDVYDWQVNQKGRNDVFLGEVKFDVVSHINEAKKKKGSQILKTENWWPLCPVPTLHKTGEKITGAVKVALTLYPPHSVSKSLSLEELRMKEPVTGVFMVSDPDDAEVDIIFVHGFVFDHKHTWVDSKGGVFWPSAWLASDLPSARIMTVKYDAQTGSATSVDCGSTIFV